MDVGTPGKLVSSACYYKQKSVSICNHSRARLVDSCRNRTSSREYPNLMRSYRGPVNQYVYNKTWNHMFRNLLYDKLSHNSQPFTSLKIWNGQDLVSQTAKPPEAESIIAFRCAIEEQICPFIVVIINCSNIMFEKCCVSLALLSVWNFSVVRNLFQMQLEAWLQFLHSTCKAHWQECHLESIYCLLHCGRQLYSRCCMWQKVGAQKLQA